MDSIVYIVIRDREIIKAYHKREEAEKQIKKFVKRQDEFKYKDFTIFKQYVF